MNGTVMVANFWPWSSKLEPPSTLVVAWPKGHPNDSAPPGNSLRHSRKAVVHLGQSTVFDFSLSLLPQQYPSIRWFLSFEISRILSSKEPAPFIFGNRRRRDKNKRRLKINVGGFSVWFHVCRWFFYFIIYTLRWFLFYTFVRIMY